MVSEGSVFKYGDNVNTDVIIPARYLNMWEEKDLAAHCMEDIDKEFIKKVKVGDVVVAGRNFGCGSSREHAPIALKACGVSCVIAKSFGRIFYRNSINIGFPIMESDDAPDKISAGDRLRVDFSTGEIYNVTKNEVYVATAFPEFIQNIIAHGGLLPAIAARQE